jgi:hypothetical protein
LSFGAARSQHRFCSNVAALITHGLQNFEKNGTAGDVMLRKIQRLRGKSSTDMIDAGAAFIESTHQPPTEFPNVIPTRLFLTSMA